MNSSEALRITIIVMIAIVAVFVLLLILSGILNRSGHKIKENGNVLWKDRKHTFMGFPFSFTVFSITQDRLFVKRGFLNIVEDEVRLYRVLDISLKQTLGQRILGLGTIELKTSDKSLKNFVIESVCHARDVKELLSEKVEVQRKENRISGREFMAYDEHDGDELEHDGENEMTEMQDM